MLKYEQIDKIYYYHCNFIVLNQSERGQISDECVLRMDIEMKQMRDTVVVLNRVTRKNSL